MNRYRLPVGMRTVGSAALLALLGFSGYMGAARQSVQQVSVPVVRETSTGETLSARTLKETKASLQNERLKELALLDSVIENPDSGAEIRENALMQKAQIASRMEHEASIEATLSLMGFADCAVVCAAEAVTVFLPVHLAKDEHTRVQVVDAAVTHTGLQAQDVKIILSKK